MTHTAPTPPAAQASPAAVDALVAELYTELRAVAHGQRWRMRAGDTLHTTALVHEAYAKMASRSEPTVFVDRSHFFRIAARVMRDILVDYARAQQAAKRGGGYVHVDRAEHVEDAAPARELDIETILSVHDAVERLGHLDSEAARVVELRYFGGLSNTEAGEALSLSVATVKRRWTFARAWLLRDLNPAMLTSA